MKVYLPLLLSVALLPCPAASDQARLIETDREAAEARVEMVLEAREEVLAESFIMGHDPLTLTGLALLRDAARRGIAVKVIVDAQWNKIPPAVQNHLLAEGVEIREYHPFRLDRPFWITRRMHDKLLVIDGKALLAGGRNVESPYFGLGSQIKRRNYLDLDVRVDGDAAAEARAYFYRLWESREVRKAQPSRQPRDLEEAARELDRHQSWLDARIAAARSDPGRTAEPMIEVGPVEFLHDPVGRKGIDPGVAQGLRDLLEGARESVVIESPYLVPSRAFQRALEEALKRGVSVRILTNSMNTTDNLWPQAGYVGHRKPLVQQGVELWEYQGPESLHAKAAVIDGETVIVGSFNLDPRSESLNTELAVVMRDAETARSLLATMDEHLTRAVRIDERGWPEGASEPYPGVPRKKVAKLRLYRLLTPFIRSQL
jgi:phosphatidylserine/phosphatidylglycerophosphate/cardiolipin synthase-like enzyme